MKIKDIFFLIFCSRYCDVPILSILGISPAVRLEKSVYTFIHSANLTQVVRGQTVSLVIQRSEHHSHSLL